MKRNKDDKGKEAVIRSSAAEYLTFVASTGENDASYEMRYEDEHLADTEDDGGTVRCVQTDDFPAYQTHLCRWRAHPGGNCQEILDGSNRGQSAESAANRITTACK